MRAVDLVLPRTALLGWHAELARRLVSSGCDVACLFVDAPARPVSWTLLELAERRLYRPARRAAPAQALPRCVTAPRGGAVLVDLSGRSDALPGAVAPSWNGRAGEAALGDCALGRAAPLVALVRDGVILASARPALTQTDVSLVAREMITTCFMDLLSRYLNGAPLPSSPVALGDAPARGETPLSFLFGNLGAKVARRLARSRRSPETWRTGWRRHGGATMATTLRWPDEGYSWLPDDGQRYYADPFLFSEGGRTFLFVEEYPFATGKGVISVTELTDGAPATPRVVVERPWHLSYPNVFAESGEIWMVPESSAGGRLELLRARRFPDEWEVAGELVSDAALNDATFFEHDGLWWMTATQTAAQSPWDQLVLYSAPSRLGPWTRRCSEPVLIDAASARPAGHVVLQDSALLRPVQDCARIYGGALSLCRIDRIGQDDFAQTLIARIPPPPGADGFHTLNADAQFEVVDIFEAARIR